MYKLKQIPEDFRVTEIIDYPKGKGYHYYWLWKVNLNTQEAIEMLARKFDLPLRMFGFAGNKDKKAITRQLISIKVKVREYSTDQISLTYVDSGGSPISLGDNTGNHFDIVVRNISNSPSIKPKFVNFFGEQRFSENNVEIGRRLVKKNFNDAAQLISGQNYKEVAEFLKNNPTNAIGALQLLPKKTLKLFVHAYQSFIWNETVRKCLDNKIESSQVPVVGFGTEFSSEKVEKIVVEILDNEGITLRDFVIPQIPYISSEGTMRKMFVEARNLEQGKLEDDELNEGMQKVDVSFDLDKGCYATEFIRQNFEDV